MYMAVIGALLFLLAFVVNELLKRASQLSRGGSHVYCRYCNRSMEQVAVHWAYRLPFEAWVIVAKYQLRLTDVKRYLCPDKHCQTWRIEVPGPDHCEVLVTRSYRTS